jgi:preprotein translocase subunit YajC
VRATGAAAPADARTMAMITRTVVVVAMLMVSALVTVILVDIVHRRRARQLVDGHIPGLKPGDRVLTHFGFEATVMSIEDHLVALRFGSGEQERTILAVRGAILRKTADGDQAAPEPHGG